MIQNIIRVVGAREHNLKNISVDIPRDKLVVITGLSGSGKSSLAFDTIFAEGQRRYVESLSAYARQFLGQMEKPDVTNRGLSRPCPSIRRQPPQPTLDVGTSPRCMTTALLFCPGWHSPLSHLRHGVVRQSAQEIVEILEGKPEGSKLLILAPIVRGRKGTYQAVFDEIRKAGFVRVRADGVVYSLDEEITLDRYKIHNIEAVVDRIVLSKGENADDERAARSRLTDSVETALKVGEGYLIVQDVTTDTPVDYFYSEHLACPVHGISLPEIEPRTFSFNTPHGACPDCQGLGSKLEIDPELLIPDKDRSLNDGAIVALEWNGARGDDSRYYWQMVKNVAAKYHISLDAPVSSSDPEKLDKILYGTHGEELKMVLEQDDRHATYTMAFEGVIPNLERRYRETNSEYIRNKITEFMSNRPCPTCGGKRLRPEALAVTVDDHNIIEVTDWPVLRTLDWMRRLAGEDTPLTSRDLTIGGRIFKEFIARLGFLVDVGLDISPCGLAALLAVKRSVSGLYPDRLT